MELNHFIRCVFMAGLTFGNFAQASPAPGAPASSDDLKKRIEKRVLDRYAAVLNPIVSGATIIYAGNFSAHDNMSVLGDSRKDGVFTDGPAVAALIAHQDPAPANSRMELNITSLIDRSHNEILQEQTDPQKTLVAFPAELQTGDGFGDNGPPNCTECLVDLGTRPEAIRISLTADTSILKEFGSPPVPVHVDASGLLQKKSRASIQFADIEALNVFRADLGGFTKAGNDMVQTLRGTEGKTIAVPAGSHHLCCMEYTDYSIEIHVQSDKIGNFFTKNFRANPARVSCSDIPEGCE